MTAGADPEKWKERWLKWAHQSSVAKFLVNQLFIRVCYLLCVNPCALAAVSVLRPSWREWSKLRCLAFCSKYVDYSLFTLSEWLHWYAFHHTLRLQEWFVQVNQSAQTKNIMDTGHPRGVASHPIHPPVSAPGQGKTQRGFGFTVRAAKTLSGAS